MRLATKRDMRLQALRISNLACFDELEFRPGQCTLLLGQNGAGKSTLFDVLFDLRSLVVGAEEVDEVMPDYQPDNTEPAVIAMDVHDGTDAFRYEVALSQAPHGFRTLSFGPLGLRWGLVGETLTYAGEVLTSMDAQGRFQETGRAASVELAQDRSPLSMVRFAENSLVSVFRSWLDGIWMLRLAPQHMAGSAAEPEPHLDVSGANFAAWCLGDPRVLSPVPGRVRSAIPDLDRLEFEASGREQVLVAQFQDGRRVDFDGLSDGQRCLIVLHTVWEAIRDHATLLLLDEPDAHVTPEEILPLFTALTNLADDGLQVIVATHHPDVIDQLATETTWEFFLDQGRARAVPFDLDRSTGVRPSRHLLLRPGR